MVAQFPIEPIVPLQIATPEIKITVNTFLSPNPVSLANPNSGNTRTCTIAINVSRLNRSIAHNTFERIFSYVQDLANNDLNPTLLINERTIAATDAGNVFSPTGICNISVDKSETIAIVNLSLQVSNLRLDYMDEYFGRTLTYLTDAIANDLNPGT